MLRGIDIPDGKKMFHFLDTGNSVIRFYLIEPAESSEVEMMHPKTLKAISGTMKLHQLLTDKELNVMHFVISFREKIHTETVTLSRLHVRAMQYAFNCHG